MSRSLSRTSLRLFAGLLIAGFLSACSGAGSSSQPTATGGTGPQPAGTGGITFRLAWLQPLGKALSPTFNACVDHSIATIAATVSAGTTTVTTASFPCSAHQGVILGVPAGTNYSVRVNGLSSGPTTTTWSGLVSGITVTSSQTTNAGTIVMGFIGTDTVRPTVTSLAPQSNPTITTNVPVTDRVTIAFSKSMAISTITSTNIKLINTGDSSSVAGVVSYGTGSTAATFVPSASLTPSTTYAVQVASCVTTTTCITDVSGNLLATNYSNTFTTEAPPSGIPAAPTGVTATAGNGQIRLDWLAMNGASSYNIYFSTTPGVTTATGTPMLGVQDPALHLSLLNGTTYFYIITAVNSFGESAASAQASATPAFPGGNPLPPASLTVTPGSGQNTLTWPAVTGATSYNLYWSPRPIYPDKYSADNVVRGVSSPFLHTGLTNGQLYCYIVTANNANGESADSMQVCEGGAGSIIIVW